MGIRVLVAGAAILFAPQLFRSAETIVNDPRLVMVAAELKAATGDTDGALQLLNRTNKVDGDVAANEQPKAATRSCSSRVKS